MNRIRQIRMNQGITQEELGKLIGVQSSAISKYEKEIVPLTDDTIRKLSKIFSVTSDFLICNEVDDILNNEVNEYDMMRKALQKVGFINNINDLTDNDLDKIIDFLVTNKKFLKSDEK